ncbi:hypothetical protein O181_000259 [Austropuccinia psidii MF-1]|uniref:Uncharacterized protein n=1 Tax=Austropuccinia psidii MF-1 TaxID=1389203 RepID=A0A9Q3B8A3_9BASI|nr:hypothetical protein [Austropuccinia psidii MF-1]
MGPQPPPKGLLRPRENMRNFNHVPDHEEEEDQDCDESSEKAKEVEKENFAQNESDSDDEPPKTLGKIVDSTLGGLSHFKKNLPGVRKPAPQAEPLGNYHLENGYPNPKAPAALGQASNHFCKMIVIII